MSMPAQVLPPPLRGGDRLSRDEFMRRWDAMPDLKFAELIDGIVHMASPVSVVHSDNHFDLSMWLGNYAKSTLGCRGGSNGTWLMSGNNAPQPDLALRILPEYGGQSRYEGEYPAGAPELIVEVSYTTGAKDAGDKLRLYERIGVLEYLIALPAKKQVVWRELAGGKFREIPQDTDGLLRSRVFPGLWLDPAALWRDDFSLLAALQEGIGAEEHRAFARELASRKRP